MLFALRRAGRGLRRAGREANEPNSPISHCTIYCCAALRGTEAPGRSGLVTSSRSQGMCAVSFLSDRGVGRPAVGRTRGGGRERDDGRAWCMKKTGGTLDWPVCAFGVNELRAEPAGARRD